MSNDLARTVRHARQSMAKAAVARMDARTEKSAHKAERRERASRRAYLEALRLSDLLES